MATATIKPDTAHLELVRELEAGHRRAQRRETFLGLLFVAPAALAIFVFGLFPVLYGFVISLQGGTILPEGFVGLSNFVTAVGSFAYVLGIAFAIILVIGGYLLFRGPYMRMRAEHGDFYRYLIPAFLAAPATLFLAALAFTGSLSYAWLPLIPLLIAAALYTYFQMQHRTSVQYIVNSWGMATFLLSSVALVLYIFREMEADMLPILDILNKAIPYNRHASPPAYIYPPSMQFLAFLGIVAGAAAVYWLHHVYVRIDRDQQPRKAALFGLARWVVLLAVIALLWFEIAAIEFLRGTLTAFAALSADKLSALSPLRPARFIAEVTQKATLWTQVFTILLGTSMFGLAYSLWQRAVKRATSAGMLGMFGVAILLMVGGWLFIGELPIAAASGDQAFYDSLLRTVTYAMLTVPFQLGIGLALAYLLFYEVTWGKSFYRIVFFMPYIAPTVATASVFVLIFSLDDRGPANQIMHFFGLPTLQWLRTPTGVFEVIAKLIGGDNVTLPSALVGPSLPLVSAIIYSIWVFSGYNAVIFLAGLGGVPRELYEAAQVDGAGRWAAFRNITIPMISPTTFFLTILAIIGTFKAFTHIWVLRGTDAREALDTTTVFIFNIINGGATTGTSFPYAASLSFILFGVILVLTLVQNRLSRDQVFYG